MGNQLAEHCTIDGMLFKMEQLSSYDCWQPIAKQAHMQKWSRCWTPKVGCTAGAAMLDGGGHSKSTDAQCVATVCSFREKIDASQQQRPLKASDAWVQRSMLHRPVIAPLHGVDCRLNLP